MTDIGMHARVAVVDFLAFGFLCFYIWFAFDGLGLLVDCVKEGKTAKLSISACQKTGLLIGNALDLFSPVFGVATAVFLSALAYKPDAVDRFAASLRAGFLNMETYSFLDIMIVVFLLGWAAVGLTISFQTTKLSLALAKEWKLR